MNSEFKHIVKALAVSLSAIFFLISFLFELAQSEESRPCLFTRYDYILLPKTAMCYGIYAIQNTHEWLSEEIRK